MKLDMTIVDKVKEAQLIWYVHVQCQREISNHRVLIGFEPVVQQISFSSVLNSIRNILQI